MTRVDITGFAGQYMTLQTIVCTRVLGVRVECQWAGCRTPDGTTGCCVFTYHPQAVGCSTFRLQAVLHTPLMLQSRRRLRSQFFARSRSLIPKISAVETKDLNNRAVEAIPSTSDFIRLIRQ